MIPAVRALVYESAIGALLIPGLPLAALALEPDPRVLPGWVRIAGVVFALAGGALWLGATVTLVAHGDGTPLPLDPPRRLVVTGPYRWIRHPMHVGLVGFFAGEALLFRSLVLLGFAVVIGVAVVAWARHEDRELDARFGRPWRDYRDAVPPWLSRPRDGA